MPNRAHIIIGLQLTSTHRKKVSLLIGNMSNQALNNIISTIPMLSPQERLSTPNYMLPLLSLPEHDSGVKILNNKYLEDRTKTYKRGITPRNTSPKKSNALNKLHFMKHRIRKAKIVTL